MLFSLRNIAALLVGLACIARPGVASPITDEDLLAVQTYSFDSYLRDYGKSYPSDEEYERRRIIFESNRGLILEHNRQQQVSPGDHHYVLGWTPFADLLDEELPVGYDKRHHALWQPVEENVATLERRKLEQIKPNFDNLPMNLVGDVPASVDWRSNGRVTTPIKNQGGCGSCWAFAATAALESHIAIRTGKLFSLSMQELVSCAPNPKDCGGQGGCTGSTAELAYDFVAKHGVAEEWSFSYQSGHGEKVNCTILPDANEIVTTLRKSGGFHQDHTLVRGAVASIVGFSNLPSNHYETLMVAVATMGPVVINVAASGWGLYKGGVYDDDSADTRDINHAVVLEGYSTDQETGQDYWLVRNSWGPLWGEDGYIRLKRVDPTTLDDPSVDCKLDDRPGDGVACKKDDNGNDIKPDAVPVCGTSGILFDGVIPIGGHLL